ncbi:type I polyketide synthase [Hydrocoleum sp. CS-953]|uniref:type I polyketide synthase n=1 Tax=Microcoleaceae TaxID=1892252 RepID=UPI000B9AC516|nr:type I polyketide synthase [Hydrocoleum sp. CS-953]
MKEQQKSDLIAIIGIACRFPGADDYNQFWENMEAGVNSITEIPPQRWEIEKHYSPIPNQPNKTISKWGGLVKGIDEFDAEFFSISRREAGKVDPQHRIMLELSWSCIEDGGYSPSELSGKDVGVFMGACNYDSILLMNRDQENVEGHSGTGTWTCMIPNRISSFFNFHGPSIPIDTACSSSLVAIHYALKSLKESECEMALVGGISVLFTSTTYIQMSQLGMLSPTGQCRTFSSDADGYVRGEGAGVVLLKPLTKAIEDGDRIYSVIQGSAINHGGRARTITSPNVYSQAQVIRAAYSNANISPDTVSYIESHGTGTPLGDPIEINALKRAYRQLYQQYGVEKTEKPYCGIGAVKSNVGHLEGAAGIAGLIKVLLAMKYKKLPKIVNFKELNPRINIKDTPFYFIEETQEWKRLKNESGEEIPRRAGLSSFGIGGVNAHIVLEEPQEEVKNEDSLERPLQILTLSAKTEKALRELATKYKTYLESQTESSLPNICFSANTGRTHFAEKLAIVAESNSDLPKKLADFLQDNETSRVLRGKAESQDKEIAFLFTGQGSQYIDMGRQLYETQPTFQKILDQCNEILKEYLEVPLLEVLYPQNAQNSSSLLDQTSYTQPALFALEYALAKLWESWGIKPNVVMGHSVGEYVAATVAGVFNLEDGLKLIAMRGRLMQKLPPGGEMVSLLASESLVREAIGEYSSQVAIAAINGPESIVISGESEAIASICSKLESAGVKTKHLQVSHAFHSPLMEPMLSEFEAVANQITYNKPKIPVVSNLIGTIADDSIASAQYWVDHVRQPVRFAQGMEALHKQGAEIFLEIGPKPILLGMGRQCLMGTKKLWFPSLRSGKPDWLQMLQSLGELYIRGIKIDWLGFDRDYLRYKVALPTYPWQRKKYWPSNIQPKKNQVQNSSEIKESDREQAARPTNLEKRDTPDIQQPKLKLSNPALLSFPKTTVAQQQPAKRELAQLKVLPTQEELPQITQQYLEVKNQDIVINQEPTQEPKTMNREQVEQLKQEYEEKGYCQVKKLFDISEIKRIQETLDNAKQASNISAEKVSMKLGGVDDIDTTDHAYDLVKYDFVSSFIQEKLALLNYITGKNLMIMHNALFSVEPNRKGLSWHVGVGSFSFTKTEDYGASIWIPLDIITKEYRGGMQYVPLEKFPGQFYYTVFDLHLQNNIKWDESQGDLNDYVANANTIYNNIQEDVIDYTIKDSYEEDPYDLGDAFFFNKYVLHRSVPLKPGLHKLRRAFVIRLVDYDTRVDEQRLGLFSKYSQLHSRYYKTLPRYNKDSVLVMVSRAVNKGLKSPYLRDIPHVQQTLPERMATGSISFDEISSTPSPRDSVPQTQQPLRTLQPLTQPQVNQVNISEVKQVLKKQLAEALYTDISEIAEDKKFVDLGLDSIIGVELTNTINQIYNLNLKATKLYDYPTLLELAPYIAQILSTQGTNSQVNQVGSVPQTQQPLKTLQPLPQTQVNQVNVSEVKQTLKAQLAEALYTDISEIAEDKKFVDLGLDSIIGVELTNTINQTYNLNLKATKLYDYPTLLDLAPYIAQEIAASGNSKLTQGNGNGAAPQGYSPNNGSSGASSDEMSQKERLRAILNKVANNELTVQEANQLVKQIKQQARV